MVYVATLGFDEAFIKSLSIALNNRADKVCALGNITDAHILLVDTDRTSDQEWRHMRRKRQVALLAISGNTEALAGHRTDFAAVLSKPLQFSELMTAIRTLPGKLEQTAVGDLQADMNEQLTRAGRQIDKGPSTKAVRVQRATDLVESGKFLLGSILKALRTPSDRPVYFVQWSDGRWLAIDRTHREVVMSMRKKMLRPFAIMPLKDQSLSILAVGYEQLDPLREQVVDRADLEEFLWSLTFWTTRTNRLDTLDLDRVYHLRHWPNLTRYAVSDMDIPLANYWVSHPSSVKELIARMGIEPEKVLPFAACCLACGFLEEATHTQPTLAAPSPPSRLRRILSQTLGKMSS